MKKLAELAEYITVHIRNMAYEDHVKTEEEKSQAKKQ